MMDFVLVDVLLIVVSGILALYFWQEWRER